MSLRTRPAPDGFFESDRFERFQIPESFGGVTLYGVTPLDFTTRTLYGQFGFGYSGVPPVTAG